MKTRKNLKPLLIKTAAAVIWIFIWQFIALAVNDSLVLVTPLQVLSALGNMISVNTFWQSIWGSFSRIASGFLLAAVAAVLFSILSYKIKYIKEFLSPPMTVFRTVPVASFIILLLISLQSKENLSTIVCFIMVLPILYTNTLAGLESIDKKMIDMARSFRVNPCKKFVYLYTYQTLPHFATGCKVALGLCWKSGVAAELIGLIQGTIGNELYFARLFLMMDRVFAWTVVIVIISVLFELLVLGSLKMLKRRLEK